MYPEFINESKSIHLTEYEDIVMFGTEMYRLKPHSFSTLLVNLLQCCVIVLFLIAEKLITNHIIGGFGSFIALPFVSAF